MSTSDENFLLGLPDLVFELVFSKAEFYDYNFIESLIKKLPFLEDKIILSVKRIDLNIVSNNTIDTVIDKYIKLKELNLVRVKFDTVYDMKQIVSKYEIIHNLIECHIDTNMFAPFMFPVFLSVLYMLKERRANDLIFDITDSNDTHFKYVSDNKSRSLTFVSNASRMITSILGSNMNQIRNLNIGTLILPIDNTALELVQMNSVSKLIIITGPASNQLYEHVNIFDILFMNHKYNTDEKDRSNTSFIPDEMNGKYIRVYNLSINEITYDGNANDFIVDVMDGRYTYVYPEINKFDLPIEQQDIQLVRTMLPNVHTFNVF